MSTSNESVNMLALEIADDAAPCELESNCVPVSIDGDAFYDLDSLNEDEKHALAGIIRYCELRGLIKRHPEQPNLFQTLEP
jgi:hypothetical protein